MLKDFIDEYLYNALHLSEDENYILEKRDAKELLSVKRLDLIAKYMYLKFQKENINSELASDIYKSHIGIFSEGKFYEPGSNTKKCYAAFLREFDLLYDGIKQDGFDPNVSLIPLSGDDVLINGGHRIAIALYLNLSVDTIKFIDRLGENYGYEYFAKKQLNPNYLDFLSFNYLEITNRPIYVICLWPKAVSSGKMAEAIKMIKEQTGIIYSKKINFNRLGLKSFMMQIYGHQTWIGNEENNYSGVYGKLDECFAENDTWFYFVEGGSLEYMIDLKEKIRNIFNIGNHSVHITDNRNEAIEAARLLLNRNSVKAMNYGQPEKLNFLLRSIKKEIEIDKKNCILNPLYTLGIYGMEVPSIEKVAYDAAEIEEDIFYDTRNFFYYRGFKFFAPDLAPKYVSEKYLQQFESILKIKDVPLKSKIKEKINKSKYILKRNLVVTLRKIGLLEIVVKILQK